MNENKDEISLYFPIRTKKEVMKGNISRKRKKELREEIFKMMETLIRSNKNNFEFNCLETRRSVEMTKRGSWSSDIGISTSNKDKIIRGRYSSLYDSDYDKQFKRFYDALCYVYRDIDLIFISLQEVLIGII